MSDDLERWLLHTVGSASTVAHAQRVVERLVADALTTGSLSAADAHPSAQGTTGQPTPARAAHGAPAADQAAGLRTMCALAALHALGTAERELAPGELRRRDIDDNPRWPWG